MKILITGGNGLLGRHLVFALRERREGVRALALPSDDTRVLEELGVTVYRGDVRQRDSLVEATTGVDAVFHLAGMMGVWRPIGDYREVNVIGTENVCSAALAAGVGRVVHVSSWTVYGIALGRHAREDSLLKPFPEPYSITKAEGDLAVQRMVVDDRLPAVIVRPGTFFGPGDVLHFGRIADLLRAGKGLIVGPGDNALPFVYVTDVVQGLLLALDHEEAVGQAYNITNDHPLSQQQFVDSIADEVGAPRARVHVPYAILYASACAAERIALLRHEEPLLTRQGVKIFGSDNRHSIEKARRELGYEPQVALRDGVRRAAEWYGQESAHVHRETWSGFAHKSHENA